MTASNYNKRTNLLLVLSGIFITSAILAELIGVKIFSLEAMLDAPPAQAPAEGLPGVDALAGADGAAPVSLEPHWYPAAA